jgi:hypothetical protein
VVFGRENMEDGHCFILTLTDVLEELTASIFKEDGFRTFLRKLCICISDFKDFTFKKTENLIYRYPLGWNFDDKRELQIEPKFPSVCCIQFLEMDPKRPVMF